MDSFLKRHRFFIILESAAVVLIAVLMLWESSLVGTLSSQKAAARWQKSGRYAQISAFFAAGHGMDENAVYTLRTAVNSALTQASITAPTNSARLWYDAYSAETSLSAATFRASVNAAVTAVGGDFFRIHPLPLESGWYFSDSDITQDRVLLDTVAAWQLFGSYDVAGMEVTIAGRPFVVAGVVSPEPDRYTSRAYGEAPRIYMSYVTLSDYQQTELTCYEAVLPDPVTGFAQNLLAKQLPVSEGYRQIIENSARFTFSGLLALLKDFAASRMVSVPVVYPYWENAARMLEIHAVLLQLAWMVLCIVPITGIIVITVRLWKGRRLHFKDIPDYYERAREFFKEKRLAWKEKQAQKPSRKKRKATLPEDLKETEHEESTL